LGSEEEQNDEKDASNECHHSTSLEVGNLPEEEEEPELRFEEEEEGSDEGLDNQQKTDNGHKDHNLRYMGRNGALGVLFFSV
jgi:hypothetical protein